MPRDKWPLETRLGLRCSHGWRVPAHRGGFPRLSTTALNLTHMNPTSRVLPAFAEGFADKYAERRYLRPGDALPIIVPDVHHDDRATEAKRAYELANCATHEWVSWGLAPYKDEGHDLARSYVSQVPVISDHDSAHQAEGLLGQACDLLSGKLARTCQPRAAGSSRRR